MTFTQLSNQETYLTIHEDGRIEVSENLQPSETAALVLECMRTKWMADAQSIKIRDQQERIKRLEEALAWYETKVSDCNRQGPEGDAARDALAKDYGRKAKEAQP
jgi:hypothetical protein